MVTLPWRKKNSLVRVLVVGDLILDEYLDGAINRISPEAPVPIHQVKSSSMSAGGAGNVARSVQLAGGEAILCSVWGQDEAAKQLESIFKIDRIDTSLVLQDSDRPTIRKTRISSNNHQVIRLDWEKVMPIAEPLQRELFSRLSRINFDVILLSDYGKGCLATPFVRQIIEYASLAKVPVVVDPKGKDYSKYRGAYLITPNRKEACDALDLDHLEPWEPLELARRLWGRYQLSNVLITLGPEGMLLYSGEGSEPCYLPTQAREVFDVSGAGDTVVSSMALGLGAGATLGEAMVIANLGAGRVVEKWGTQPITEEELAQALQKAECKTPRPFSRAKEKILRFGQVRERLAAAAPSTKVVFTNGCFDILHAGHVTYLEQARELGDLLVVGLNTDASIQRLKGSERPIIPEEQRALLLAALSCVDYVILFDEDTPESLISSLIPAVLVKGGDYTIETMVGAKRVLEAGGRVETIPLVDGLSTSSIVEAIRGRVR